MEANASSLLRKKALMPAYAGYTSHQLDTVGHGEPPGGEAAAKLSAPHRASAFGFRQRIYATDLAVQRERLPNHLVHVVILV